MAFQILSLSGGGFFGLYSITIIAELEKRIGAPIASRFDLIAGTSVGGILALGLAFEIPAQKIKTAFEDSGTRIFSDRPTPRSSFAQWNDLRRFLFKPKYESVALRETVVAILGEDTKLGDLKHPCIIPAVNLTKGGPQLFKTGHHRTIQRDPKCKAVDVALATSAAPSYFPIAEVNDELFADGGLFANSPDLIALHEAEHFFEVPAAEVHILSIGTTTTRFSFSHETGVNFGILGWAWGQRLVRAMMSSQQLLVHDMLRHKLGDRYLRIDRQQSREQEEDLALDVATTSAQKTMRGLAEASVRDVINDPLLTAMLKHNPKPPVFYSHSDPAT